MDVQYIDLKGDRFKYEAVLNLINVNFTYVGYFYCVKNSTIELNRAPEDWGEEDVSKIYVFVDGKRDRLLEIILEI